MKKYHHVFDKHPLLVSTSILTIIIFLIYANSFPVGFHFDDLLSIVHNRNIQQWDSFLDMSFWANPNNRPLGYFSFALNYAIHGLNPAGYHLVNILIHLINALLAFKLTVLLLQFKKPEYSFRRLHTVALIAAVLFAIHPLQTMAVTYIVQRLTLMAAMFYLTGIYSYLKARLLRNEISARRRMFYFSITGLAFILGMMSKQIVISMPLMLLMAEWLIVQPAENKTPVWIRISAALTGIVVVVLLVTGLMPSETDKISRADYLMTQSVVLIEYIKLIFWPVHLNLDHFLPVQNSFFTTGVISGTLLFLWMLASIFFLRKKGYALASFGIAWFLIALSVESTFIPISDVMFEHRLYLPLAGFITVAVIHLDLVWTAKRWKMPMLLVIIMVFYGWRTIDRNDDWQDEYTLWNKSMKQYPENPRAVNSVGLALKKKGNISQALEYYNKALTLEPGMVEATFNRGIIYFELGDYRTALEAFNEVISKVPGKMDAIAFRALTYGHIGLYEESLADFNAYVAVDPTSPKIYMQRGIVHEMAGNFTEAIDDYTRSMKLDLSNTILLINRSRVYFRIGRLQEAYDDIIKAAEAGHQTDPRYVEDLKASLGITD
jgi:Flp pilus assembly protein TadD